MHKLEITLKQHTPLIHFQHDQEGATLRASEVKPKLDRFILTRLGRNPTDEQKNAGIAQYGKDKITKLFDELNDYEKGKLIAKGLGWLVGKGEHGALDYKINFNALIKENTLNIDYKETKDGKFSPKFPCIFGNVIEEEKKVFRICNEQRLSIKTYYNTLNDYINPLLTDFFFITNLGFRQSKGFGSFYTGDFNPTNKEFYYFTLRYKKEDYKALFNAIDLFYKCLKSGLNLKNYNNKTKKMEDKLYFKSLLFKYAKKQKPSEQWDKRTIRHSLFLRDWNYKKDSDKSGVFYNRTDKDGTVHYNVTKTENQNYYDFRDMLGLSTEQEWSFYRDNITKTVNGKNQFEIERFQSPIIFKPYYCNNDNKWYIHVLVNQIPIEYIGASVEVVNKRGYSVNLVTYPQFSTTDYLRFAIDNFNISDFEYGNGFDCNSVKEVSLLNDIFSQLKQQLT